MALDRPLELAALPGHVVGPEDLPSKYGLQLRPQLERKTSYFI